MEHADFIDAAERELVTAARALAAGPMDADVPTCKEWDVTGLATHVGQVCAFWTKLLCEGSGRPRDPMPAPPEPQGLVEWVEGLGEILITELRATHPETEVWTWYEPDQSAGFVARRMAHEMAIHRYDAQSARGTCQPIEPHLAADGIDEVMGPLMVGWKKTGAAHGQTIHLHGTDEGVDAEWLLVLQPEGVHATHEHAKGDLALRGSVSDLELLLYQRPPLGPIERHGDESVLDVWRAEFSL